MSASPIDRGPVTMRRTPFRFPGLRLAAATTLVAAAAVVTGCAEDLARRSATGPRPAVSHLEAYLTLSDSAPAAGDVITVTAVVDREADDRPVGSFAARLRFDHAGLAFVEEAPLASGMRVLNATPVGLNAAGAAPGDGFADGRLFSVRMKVNRPEQLKTLELDVREMTAVDFRNSMPKLSVRRTLSVEAPR